MTTKGKTMRPARVYTQLNLFALISLLFFVFITGCASPQFVNLAPDRYLIFKEDHAGILGNMQTFRTAIIAEANTFAESKGMVAYPIAAKTVPVQSCAACWGSFEYQFKLVKKNDNETPKTRLVGDTDVVVDEAGNVAGEMRNPAPARDVHADLIKLDDLRKKGIISESEFDEQKKRLLKGM